MSSNTSTSEPNHATQLDHVIILLPYEDIVNPPRWVTNNFTVSPGGKHADNKTENRLILFADGTYIELIAFINDDPAKRKGHWWDKPFGIVDFALTTQKPFDYAALQERLKASNSDVSYAEPKEGGRRRPDGQELKWKVTFPLGAERGEVPFWCHDVTPRERRVPVSETNTKHPCHATGMSKVTVEVLPDRRDRVRIAMSAITEEPRQNLRGYAVGTPRPDEDEGERVDSWIDHIPTRGRGVSHQICLTLKLPRDGKKPTGDIEERVGDGAVFIGFER